MTGAAIVQVVPTCRPTLHHVIMQAPSRRKLVGGAAACGSLSAAKHPEGAPPTATEGTLCAFGHTCSGRAARTLAMQLKPPGRQPSIAVNPQRGCIDGLMARPRRRCTTRKLYSRSIAAKIGMRRRAAERLPPSARSFEQTRARAPLIERLGCQCC